MPPSLTEAAASSMVSLLRTVSYILLFRVESRTPCRRKSRYFFCKKTNICHVTRFLLCLLQKKVDMRYMEVREIVKPWASFWILKDHVSCRSPKPIHVNPRCSKIDQVRICRQKKVSSLSTPYLCNPDEDF